MGPREDWTLWTKVNPSSLVSARHFCHSNSKITYTGQQSKLRWPRFVPPNLGLWFPTSQVYSFLLSCCEKMLVTKHSLEEKKIYFNFHFQITLRHKFRPKPGGKNWSRGSERELLTGLLPQLMFTVLSCITQDHCLPWGGTTHNGLGLPTSINQ